MLADALDYFLVEVMRLPIKKALDPNDPADFNQIVAKLAASTKGLTQPAEGKALKAALDALDVDWKAMSAASKLKVVNAAKAALNPSKLVLPKIEQHFEANAAALGKTTKGSAVKQFGFKLGVDLTQVEQESLWHIALSQSNYVRDEYGVRSTIFGNRAKEIVAEGLRGGLSRKEIANELRTQLSAQQFNRSENYWTLVAGAFANRARTYTNLATYEAAGVEFFEFDAVMDERTSEICRFMHGKRFAVSDAKKLYEKSDTSQQPEDVKTIQPWVSESGGSLWYKDGNGQKQIVANVTTSGSGKVSEAGKYANALSDKALSGRGIMTPPLHGHCRSTINPVLESGGVVTSAPGNVVVGVPASSTPSAPAFQLTPPEDILQPTAKPPTLIPIPKEQEALLFGPGGIKNAPIVELKPVAPAAKPVKAYIPVGTKKKNALAALETYIDASDPSSVLFPMQALSPEQAAPFMQWDNKAKVIAQILDEANHDDWKKQKKAIDSLKVVSPTDALVNPDDIKHLINNPKTMGKVQVLEVTGEKVGSYWKKNYIVVEGHESVFAQKLLGAEKIDVEIINLKEWEKLQKEKAKLAAAGTKAAPLPPPAPFTQPPPIGKPLSTKPPIDPANILNEKTGDARGSNDGGFYKGKDGVNRYVKFYNDEAQAHGEVLANSLYKELGFKAPQAVAWKDPVTGKQVYAANVLDGSVLGLKPSQKDAREFMRGFAADVLMGNWDAAGQTGDNAFKLKDGGVIRIDNGGSFLMRAKAGRKDPAVLNAIPEWNRFFDYSNPGYHAMAKAAGYSSAEDPAFKSDLSKGIQDIVAVKKKWGGWQNFVDAHAPSLNTADKQAVIKMLDTRARLLEEKLTAMNAPPKPKPPPGVLPSNNYRLKAPEGKAPAPNLKLDDLPVHKRDEVIPIPKKGELPWGENHRAYRERTKKKLDDHINADDQKGMSFFTGGSYADIRDLEMKGKIDGPGKFAEAARQIERAFKAGVPEPFTVFRSMTVPNDVAEKIIQHDGVYRLGMGNKGATSSSTWHPEVAYNWGGGGETRNSNNKHVIFIIHQKSGIPIEKISHFGKSDSNISDHSVNEKEVLLPKDAEFKVLKSSKAETPGGLHHLIIELEEI